jgi:hypothetical protein
VGFNVGSGLFWGWGWLAGIGVIILLGLFLLPWFFFLLNVQTLLNAIHPANRRMSPGMVWLNFIPIFSLGWFIYTVAKVKDSVNAEFKSRAWYIDGDLGYNVGLTAGILWVASFFIGWIPFIGWVLPLAGAVCWIIYWLKISDLRNRLDSGPAWNRPGMYSSMYPPAYPPYTPRYPRGDGARMTGGGPGAPDGGQRPATAQPSAERPIEGEPVKDGAETTTATGTAETTCALCGSKYDAADRFCRGCGLRLP